MRRSRLSLLLIGGALILVGCSKGDGHRLVLDGHYWCGSAPDEVRAPDKHDDEHRGPRHQARRQAPHKRQ